MWELFPCYFKAITVWFLAGTFSAFPPAVGREQLWALCSSKPEVLPLFWNSSSSPIKKQISCSFHVEKSHVYEPTQLLYSTGLYGWLDISQTNAAPPQLAVLQPWPLLLLLLKVAENMHTGDNLLQVFINTKENVLWADTWSSNELFQ